MAKKNFTLILVVVILFVAVAVYFRFFNNTEKIKEASIEEAKSLVAGSQSVLGNISKMEELNPSQVPGELALFMNSNSSNLKLYKVLYGSGLTGYWASYVLSGSNIQQVTENIIKDAYAPSSREGEWTVGQATSIQLASNIDFVSNENPPKKRARLVIMQEGDKEIKVVIQTMNQNN